MAWVFLGGLIEDSLGSARNLERRLAEVKHPNEKTSATVAVVLGVLALLGLMLFAAQVWKDRQRAETVTNHAAAWLDYGERESVTEVYYPVQKGMGCTQTLQRHDTRLGYKAALALCWRIASDTRREPVTAVSGKTEIPRVRMGEQIVRVLFQDESGDASWWEVRAVPKPK